MLVLTRRNEESIVIDNQIKIKVLRIKGNAIRIGIEAPDEISIRRAELPDQGSRQFAAASFGTSSDWTLSEDEEASTFSVASN